MSAGICRVCQAPATNWLHTPEASSPICWDCLVTLYPAAAARRLDTQHARHLGRSARAYEDARMADEADAPSKRDRDQ